ncbi:MAG: hypothetical protein ACKVE4_08245 [Dissulfuribacterales bacterium]
MTPSKQHEKKVDRAFEVVERLEKNEKKKSASTKLSKKDTVKRPGGEPFWTSDSFFSGHLNF